MTAIYLRNASEQDLGAILTLIEQAREILLKDNIPQWQNGDGPNQALFQKDIQKDQCYVLIANKQLVGVGIISNQEEPPYRHLQGGEWLPCSTPYATIHRVAIAPTHHGQGYALLLLRYLITVARLNKCQDIRIDTHPKNKTMQHLITKAGFSFRGTIQLPVANGERFAYQLILS